MLVVGLTGGIATGKSTVSKIIAEKGIVVIDADRISREIVKPGEVAYKKIVEFFGEEILSENGEIDRKKLRNIVFNDYNKLKVLNEITHPEILKKILIKIEDLKSKGEKICVLDAALLIEANFHKFVDKVILVYCDIEIQISRLMKRDNLSREEAINIINSQMSFEQKKKYADYLIDNSKDIDFTKKQVDRVLNSILGMEEINV
ncbi:dephospho-CoA kinase [Caloramator fervidus]|uniref:dephospho-CoA kinase n=1 Tax=Caloramator fervidus TaxID=29344 RepID=UPI000CDEF323|nr:dephospho-CoA kinase [Caloramator fervidus]